MGNEGRTGERSSVLNGRMDGETVIHRLDPRVKIIAVIALSGLVFAAPPAAVAPITLLLAAVTRSARLPLARAAAAVRPVGVFMALIFLVHLFGTAGTPLLQFPPLPLMVTREGLARGAYVTWQFACLIVGAAVLTRTTCPSDLVGGIERLLKPLDRVGVPVQDLAVLIATALGFLPMLRLEYDRVRAAQLARGADFAAGGPVRRARAVAKLVMPLLLSAFRRADELAWAMEARGYRRGPRTTLREFRLAGRDFAALALLAVAVLMDVGLKALS